MRRLLTGIIFSFCVVFAADAKVYWLPDYLQDNLDRVNSPSDNNGSATSPGGSDNENLSCASWNMLSADQIAERGFSSQNCDKHSFPHIGICYDNCLCPDRFLYTSSNCSGDKILSGSVCDGKYDACVCDTSKFPYTSCPSGYIPGGTSCSDDTTRFSECTNLCDGLDDHECGEFGCQKTYSLCSSKCEVCYSDNCRNRTDNSSDYGCEKYWQDCSSKCEVGKTCTPTDCSGFNLTAAPANASYEICSKGCGDTKVYYRITQCNAGFWDLNNFLCSGNQLCTWKIN